MKSLTDSVAENIIDDAYKAVSQKPLVTREDVLRFSKDLVERLDRNFDRGEYEYLALSMSKFAKDSTQELPVNCLRLNSLFSSVINRCKEEHPGAGIEHEIVNVGDEEESHVLSRFILENGDTLYLDPQDLNVSNVGELPTEKELKERYDVSEHAVANEFYLASRDAEQLMSQDLVYHACQILSSEPRREYAHLERARDIFQYVLDRGRKNRTAMFNLGMVLTKIGEHERAMRIGKEMFSYDSTSIKARYMVGVNHYELGAFHQAISRYDEIIRRCSSSEMRLEALYLKGKAYLGTGGVKKAERIKKEMSSKVTLSSSSYSKRLDQALEMKRSGD